MNEYNNLFYQILVLIMLGIQIGLLYHLVRSLIQPKSDSLVNQNNRRVIVSPVNIPGPLGPNIIPTPFSTQIPIGK